MKKRVIGSTVYALTLYLTIFFQIFPIVILFFLIFGLYEWFRLTQKKPRERYNYFYLIILLGGLLSLYYLTTVDYIYIFMLVSLIMLNDTFALFSGKKWGKTKFSKISPNKTIEGIIGGIVGSQIIIFLFLFLLFRPLNLTILSTINPILISIFWVFNLLVADVGDLMESKIKRIAQVKDSGTIIYGHGGVLDRIDSLLLSGIILALTVYIF